MRYGVDPIFDGRRACAGFAALDQRRAREELPYDARDPPWMHSRLRSLARSYAWQLARDREEAAQRCAAGVGMLAPAPARPPRPPLVRTGLVPAALPSAFGLARCREGPTTRGAARRAAPPDREEAKGQGGRRDREHHDAVPGPGVAAARRARRAVGHGRAYCPAMIRTMSTPPRRRSRTYARLSMSGQSTGGRAAEGELGVR